MFHRGVDQEVSRVSCARVDFSASGFVYHLMSFWISSYSIMLHHALPAIGDLAILKLLNYFI